MAICLCAMVAAGASPAHAWDQPLRTSAGWFVPINVGAGPGLAWFSGVLGDAPFWSVSLDAYGIVDPRIVASMVERSAHKVPPEYRKCLNVINTDTPWHVRGPAEYLPFSLVISPENRFTGAGRSAFGIQSSNLLLTAGFVTGGTQIRLEIGSP